MTEADLKQLLERVQSWPQAAQDQLIVAVEDIEAEMAGGDYIASPEELAIIDEAIASVDAGEVASDAQVAAAFARFHRR